MHKPSGTVPLKKLFVRSIDSTDLRFYQVPRWCLPGFVKPKLDRNCYFNWVDKMVGIIVMIGIMAKAARFRPDYVSRIYS